jgi:hypothetical protein
MGVYDFLLLRNLNFFLEIFIAQNIAMHRLEKRKHWYLVLLGELVLSVGLYWMPSLSVGVINFVYLVIAVISGFFCFFIYKESVFDAISYTAIAFAFQNITWNILLLFGHLLPSDAPQAARIALYLGDFAFFYLGAFFLVHFALRKVPMRSNWLVCLSSALIILITIFLSQIAKSSNLNNIVAILYEMVSCLFALLIQYGVSVLIYLVGKEKDLESEKAVLEEMLHQQAKQQKMSKETIDIINLKSHDLKNQITALEHVSPQERTAHIEEIKKAVNIYGDIVKTGNEALDLVLTEKSLLCESKHISFNYIVNPESLSFIDELDIFSLFGNALDNAIEALEKEEEGKRIIRLNINQKNKFTTIHLENYCSQAIRFKDGLPLTSKNDTDYHGYGLKSIMSTVEKYHGNSLVKLENSLFILDIMIPVK